MLTSRMAVVAALLSLSLLTVLGTGCSKNDAADSAAPPPSGAAASAASAPPQSAATAAQANQAMEAQKRMNEEMAKGRQAAEAAGNK